jgi:hypothetical protein
MTDDCRCLFRAGQIEMPRTNVAPQHPEEREEMADFLNGALMKPLHHSVQQHRLNVEQSLNTMTRAERVYLEIEMQERARAVHSFDYDPLR